MEQLWINGPLFSKTFVPDDHRASFHHALYLASYSDTLHSKYDKCFSQQKPKISKQYYAASSLVASKLIYKVIIIL